MTSNSHVSEVRVLVADLGTSCRALSFDGENGIPVIVANEPLRHGDPIVRESAFRLVLDGLNKEQRT